MPTAPTPEVRGPRTPRTLVSIPPTRPATSVTLSRPVPSRVESVWDWGWLVRPERVEVADWMSEVTWVMPDWRATGSVVPGRPATLEIR